MRLKDWIAEDLANADRDELLRKLLRERRIDTALIVLHVAALAVALATVALLAWRARTADLRDRTAWNEGYFGVDHQTALTLAEAGVGKSAKDILR